MRKFTAFKLSVETQCAVLLCRLWRFLRHITNVAQDSRLPNIFKFVLHVAMSEAVLSVAVASVIEEFIC